MMIRLHWICSVLVVGVAIGHLMALHVIGSAGARRATDDEGGRLPISEMFVLKDSVVIIVVVMFLLSVRVWLSSDAENYQLRNETVRPTHIKPEWYFLALYSVLRSVPDKLVGVLFMIRCLLSPMMMCSTARNTLVART